MIAATHHVINRARVLDPNLPRHAFDTKLPGPAVDSIIIGPTPFTTPRMVKVRSLKGTLPVGGRKLSDNGSIMYQNPDTVQAEDGASEAMSEKPKEV